MSRWKSSTQRLPSGGQDRVGRKEIYIPSNQRYSEGKEYSKMRSINEEEIKNFYVTDEYIVKNPSLHEEDSPWKVSKIIPLIDTFVEGLNRDEINLLDVGGGAGLILNAVSYYIEETCKIKVMKFALDLSPGMLKIQKKRNQDIKKSLNEDISKTSLANKEMDLTLMIDVLEHVTNPTETLKELQRISKFVIFKVPLEDNLLLRTLDFIRSGKYRQHEIEFMGHINVYRFDKLKHQIEDYTGEVLDYYFTNIFEYFLNSDTILKNMDAKNKLKNSIASYIFRLSPKLCSFIFTDFVMILVKCY
jgi:ubiquinone/menaquinone biosynthesis C-methylase UbiE